MMSSKEVSLLSISFKQYYYKLKAHTDLLNRLLLTQVFALIFSLLGTGGTGTSGQLSVTFKTYSANIVIVFSILWIIIVAVLLTTRPYKQLETPLVGNRLTGNLSDFGFLMTASVFAGITSTFGGVLLRNVMYFISDRSTMAVDGFYLTFTDLMYGMVVAILVLVLVSLIFYFLGLLVQANKVFAILIPVVILGTLRVYTHLGQSVLEFYMVNVSLPLFALKVIITAMILFGISMLVSNRMEVNQ
ncbi:MAG TPA: hypothetical protein VFC84_01145 [Desulfosporosinus sp.]|nr:hypothetical protein [Desulfosporosinus sp.]